ncbi:CehA/McbA family metallohydrolase [Litoribaculum gwangyangense]|uniref:Uncharacterized protein n=1 Tax=Litoribaculum gwangyangense TaxID=1130722 RepID=A0ABP9CNK5_9FLAO
MKKSLVTSLIILFNVLTISAQWSNRYPKVDGFGHHVYLEGYELPVLNAGPTDPAPSPKTNTIAFSAKGWLWLYNTETKVANRITSSSSMDSKPNWSPDGNQIVFVRDNSSDTKIMLFDVNSNKETTLIDTKALDLDPIFSRDGNSIYYASAEKGSIDLWEIDLSTLEKKLITKNDDLERLPIAMNSKDYLIYLKKKGFSYDSIELLNLVEGTSNPLAEENFTSQAAFTLSPDNQTLAYTWPKDDYYEIRLLNVFYPESNLLLTKSNNLPLSPKFSADGQWVYFNETNDDERSELKRIRINGGLTETLSIYKWNFGIPTTKIKIVSKIDGEIIPVRMSITDLYGHPIVPETGIVHSDGQNGVVFFYSPGEIDIETTLGEIIITAVHGFSTEKKVQKVVVNESSGLIEINLKRIWNARAHGWYSGDNHFHINYGGTNQLEPNDIVLDLKAEDLDVAFPLLANLGNRFLQQDLWDWKREELPIIQFGQEIRSHFLGHLGLIGTKDLFWPWVWGPRYDIYGNDDRLNAEPLNFARNQGALGGYVHPVSVRNPFSENGAKRIPIALIADSVLEESDIIELGCLWSDEIGTAEVWHKILNIGIPLNISAGSDVMNNLYRTMAIGAIRVYTKPKGDLTVESYLEALKNGKSFVSNGPQIEFKVNDKEVGDIIKTKNKKVKWTLDVHSPLPYDKVEIFVNGEIINTQKGNTKSGSKTFNGSFEVPSGGWVTARVSGGNIEWPLMDSYPFAESSPIWFNNLGSTTSVTAKNAAQDLLKLLSVSNERLIQGYGDIPIPILTEHFEKARQKLLKIIEE